MNRQERRAAAAGAPVEEKDAREVYIAILEPIVAGLLQGQKKLVIESQPSYQSERQTVPGYIHTFKVVDSDSE